MPGAAAGDPCVFDLGRGALYPYTAGTLGTGANFVCKVAALRDLGGVGYAAKLVKRSRRAGKLSSTSARGNLVRTELLGTLAGPATCIRARRGQDPISQSRSALNPTGPCELGPAGGPGLHAQVCETPSAPLNRAGSGQALRYDQASYEPIRLPHRHLVVPAALTRAS